MDRHDDESLLDYLVRFAHHLEARQERIMADTAALTQATTDLATAVSAAVGEIQSLASGQTDQAQVDAATAAVQSATTQLNDAVAAVTAPPSPPA